MRYIAMSPNIAKVMLRGFIFGLTAIVVLALLPLVARGLDPRRRPDLWGLTRGFRGWAQWVGRDDLSTCERAV